MRENQIRALPTTTDRTVSVPASTQPPDADVSARSAGLRLGALLGPVAIGVTAAGVALPDVAASLHATPAAVAWVLTAYTLALGVGMALFGRMGDALGVRTTLLAGSLVLPAGTVLCVVAPNLGVLVAGRFVLAVGSGAMAASALTLAAAINPAKRPQVLAGLGATTAVFSASATLMGGAITHWLTWRIAVVLPALSLLAVPFCLLYVTRPVSRKPIDVLGATLLTVTASALLVLIQSPSLSLPTPIVITLAGVVVLGVGALIGQVRRLPTGFLPRSLIVDRTYLIAAAIGGGVYGGVVAAMYAVPQVLAKQYGWPVLTIGLALLPGALVGAVLSRLAGRFTAGPGGNWLLSVAAVLSAGCLALAGFFGGGAVLLVTGASLGFAAFAITQVVTTGLISVRIEPARRGGAMGILNLIFFIGGGIGAAIAGALAKSMPMTAALGLVAILPLVAGLLALALPNKQAPPQLDVPGLSDQPVDGIADTADVALINRRRRLRLGTLFTVILLSAGSSIFYWTVSRMADIPVTEFVVVSNGQEMHDGGQATIQIPGAPPQRRHLALALTLINPASVGDCVSPARLDVTPVIDGQQWPPITGVRSGQEIRLNLSSVTRRSDVIVTLHMSDPFCAVNLSASKAILYN